MAEDKKAKEKKTTTVKEFAQYEFALLAAHLNQSGGDKRDLAGYSLRKFYTVCGVDKEDPTINYAIESGGILPALQVYGEKAQQALDNMRLKDYVAYVAERGYKLSGDVKKVSELVKKYGEMTFGEIAKASEKNKELKVCLTTLNLLRHQVTEGNLYPKLVKEQTDLGFGGLEQALVKEKPAKAA
jgi:hypothetical protein